MANNEQTEQSLFFTGSDIENDDDLEYITPPQPVHRSESAPPQPEPQPPVSSLFFADSEDEGGPTQDEGMSPIESVRDSSVDAVVGIDTMDIDVQTPEAVSGGASSVSSASTPPPPAASSRASSVEPEATDVPQRKKRKLSPEAGDSDAFVSAYLGSFLVANAWSTVRGQGFVKVCITHVYACDGLILYSRSEMRSA